MNVGQHPYQAHQQPILPVFHFILNPQLHSEGFSFSIFTGRRRAPSIVAFAPKGPKLGNYILDSIASSLYSKPNLFIWNAQQSFS